jgi:hypothetical protein
LATEVEEDRRYTISKTKSMKTNFHWLHVDAEDVSVAGKEPRVFVRRHFMRVPNRA